MKKILLTIIGMASISFSATTGKIIDVVVDGSGALYVTFDKDVSSNSNCSKKYRIRVGNAHPSINHFLSVALTAKTTGADVIVNAGTSCYANQYPIMDQDENSYLILK